LDATEARKFQARFDTSMGFDGSTTP
jgi:hypothetical protein